MPDLTPEQEQQIIEDLTALDSTRASNLEPRSAQVISERLQCSTEDANLILQRLQAKKVIESISESGGTPTQHKTLDSYGWKWARMRRGPSIVTGLQAEKDASTKTPPEGSGETK